MRRQLRRGNSLVLLLLGVVGVVATVGSLFVFGRRSTVDGPELLTTTVWKGPYDFAVPVRGSIESASNVELKCEVRSRGGTAILDVVPEGTFVKEGDIVAELDPSSLLLESEQQKIQISTRESLLAQVENTLKAAEIAKTEYLEGLFVSQEKEVMAELYVAERAKASAQTALESTKKLFERAIVSALQLEAAHVTLEDATNNFDAAQGKLATLRTLTKQKELTLLEAAVDSAEASVKAERRSLQLEQQRLQNIEKFIANCTVRATAAGQVVYANEPEYVRSSTYAPFVVMPGSMVRERQTIVWLPNADDMQVRTTVNEARVTMVRPGMPVSIRIDALDDEIIIGEVTKVNQFAEPTGWSSTINKYAATIRITNPPHVLRVGMTAEAWIHVDQRPEALQLPVQALAEANGRYFSLVKNGEEYETREVEIGSTNDEVATIDRGLLEGDEVVINPRSAGDLLKLPEAPEPTPIAAGPAVDTRYVSASSVEPDAP
jgi:HlyD family secretion protein